MDRRKLLVTKLSGTWEVVWKTATTSLPLLALLLTVFSAAATHRHNRLSVIPKLSFVWDTGSENLIGLFLENSGVGPAVIKSFCISGVKRVDAADRCNDPDGLLKANRIFKKSPDGFRFLSTYFFQNGVPRIGLITIERDNVLEPDDFAKLIEGRRLPEGQVLITIEYCSVYGDCWKECSNIDDPTCGLKKSPANDIFDGGFWSKIL